MKATILLILLALPLIAQAEDSKKPGGFFDNDVADTGFFTDDQAGIPVKNPGGNITRKSSDSFEVAPEAKKTPTPSNTRTNQIIISPFGISAVQNMGMRRRDPIKASEPPLPPLPTIQPTPTMVSPKSGLTDSFEIPSPQN